MPDQVGALGAFRRGLTGFLVEAAAVLAAAALAVVVSWVVFLVL